MSAAMIMDIARRMRMGAEYALPRLGRKGYFGLPYSN